MFKEQLRVRGYPAKKVCALFPVRLTGGSSVASRGTLTFRLSVEERELLRLAAGRRVSLGSYVRDRAVAAARLELKRRATVEEEARLRREFGLEVPADEVDPVRRAAAARAERERLQMVMRGAGIDRAELDAA